MGCVSMGFFRVVEGGLPGDVEVAWVKGHVEPVGAIWSSSQPLAVFVVLETVSSYMRRCICALFVVSTAPIRFLVLTYT